MSEIAYRDDIYAWATEQADNARRRSANAIDWDNVAEELSGLANQQEWELYNRLVVLLAHLLKWRHQPSLQGKSWRLTIANQRRDVARLLRRAPSLRSVQAAEFLEAYATARGEAAKETPLELEAFPERPPFTLEDALDDAYWPEPADSSDHPAARV